MSEVTLTVSAGRTITLESVYTPGPAGRRGPVGEGAVITSVEFAISQDGDQSVGMPTQIGGWHSLEVNGIRQYPSAYTVSANLLQIPHDLIWPGAVCLFEYFPVTTG